MASFAPTGVRRIIDRQVLRIEGRLDSHRADRILPWAFAAVTATVLGLLHAAQARSLDSGSGLAPWVQAVWLRANPGEGAPMTGLDPATGSPISELVLQLARLGDPEVLFVVVQALAIALGIVPLWRLARDEGHLRVGATCVIIVAYALAPTLHRANLGAFHPELLAIPAVFGALRRGLERRWWRYSILILFILLCRADLGLTVAAIGVFLLSLDRRRPGLITMAVGLGWSAVMLLVLRPEIPSRGLTAADEFVARSAGPLASITDVLRDPLGTVATMLSEPGVGFLVLLLAPLIFLPMVSPRRLLIAVPGLVLAVVADEAVQQRAERGVLDLSPAAAHIGPVVALVFFALVFALERIGVPSISRVKIDRRVLLALLTGAVLLFVVESPTSPYRAPWSWGGRDAADGARTASVELVADDASVAVSPSVSALYAERGHLVELPPDPVSMSDDRMARVTDGVDVVILDTTPESGGEGTGFWTQDSRVEMIRRFMDRGFVLNRRIGDVYVLERS